MDPNENSYFPAATRALAEKALLSFNPAELVLADDDFLAFEVAKDDVGWYGVPYDNYTGFKILSITEGENLMFIENINATFTLAFKKNHTSLEEMNKGIYALFWHIEKQTTFIYRSDCLDEVVRKLT